MLCCVYLYLLGANTGLRCFFNIAWVVTSIKFWCPGEDSNLHGIAPTSPSS